jgi:hypothetical protein
MMTKITSMWKATVGLVAGAVVWEKALVLLNMQLFKLVDAIFLKKRFIENNFTFNTLIVALYLFRYMILKRILTLKMILRFGLLMHQ